MKNYLLLLAIILVTACNSKSKTDEKTTDEKTNPDTAIQKPADTAVTTPPPPSGKIDIESFGDLKLGQHHAEVTSILGAPGSKSNAMEWGADGLMHNNWIYKAKGIELGMSAEKGNEEKTRTIFSMTATAPCAYKTKAGMGIGSSYAEVQAAYKRDIDPEATDKTQITVGSVYGGIIFSFKNDKVEKIFIGAEAE